MWSLIVAIDLRIKSDEDRYNCIEEQRLYRLYKYNIYIYVSYTCHIHSLFWQNWHFYIFKNYRSARVYDLPIQLKIDSKILKYWSSSLVFRSDKLWNTEIIYQFFCDFNRGFNNRLWQYIRQDFLIFAYKHEVSTSSIWKICKRLKNVWKRLKK